MNGISSEICIKLIHWENPRPLYIAMSATRGHIIGSGTSLANITVLY